MKYLIVKNADFEKFQNEVNARIIDGYIPHGSLAITPENKDYFKTYHQAMVKND